MISKLRRKRVPSWDINSNSSKKRRRNSFVHTAKILSALPLLTILISSISLGACITEKTQNEKTEKSEANTFNFSRIEGRNYYLLEEGFTCRANAPGKPILKSWKNRVEFNNGEILIWETVCNDNPTVKPFDIKNFSFSKDLSLLEYQSEEYSFYEEPPKLCLEGQWCPISEQEEIEQ